MFSNPVGAPNSSPLRSSKPRQGQPPERSGPPSSPGRYRRCSAFTRSCMCTPNARPSLRRSATGWFDGQPSVQIGAGRPVAWQCPFLVDIPLCTDGDRRRKLSQADLVEEGFMSKRMLMVLSVACALATMGMPSAQAQAASETVLFNFANVAPKGSQPYAGAIRDSDRSEERRV